MEQCVSSGVIVFILQALIFVLFYQKNMSPGQSALFYGSASVKGAGKVQKMKKNEIDTRTVGGRIKYLRKQLGMGQEKLAERLHLENRSSISSYETNRRGLSGELAVAMAQELQTTTDYLLNGTEAEDAFVEEAMCLIKKVKTEGGKKAVLKQIETILMMENECNKKDK